MIRCFVALQISEVLREALAATIGKMRDTGADFRWVKPENIHLTLKFLGEIPEGNIEKVIVGLEEAAYGRRPFKIVIEGMGAFPSLGDPRVVWCGVTEGRDDLADLAATVEESLARQGFRRDKRSFSPHLTLGRQRSRVGLGALQEAVEARRNSSFGFLEIERMFLVRSVLMPSGPVYSGISEVSFDL